MKQRYQVELIPAAWRALDRLPDREAERIILALRLLAQTPRPPGAKKLKSKIDLYRVRVGDYRIIYTIEDDRLLVLVVKTGNRKDVYR